jgi:hypothetical protein
MAEALVTWASYSTQWEAAVSTVLRAARALASLPQRLWSRALVFPSPLASDVREREITGAVFSTAVAAARVARAQKVFMVVL